jgi:hypothetical protein
MIEMCYSIGIACSRLTFQAVTTPFLGESHATASKTKPRYVLHRFFESGLYLRFRTQQLAGEAKQSNETLAKDRRKRSERGKVRLGFGIGG